MRKVIFFLLISISVIKLNAISIAILPVQITGFKQERSQQFYGSFIRSFSKYDNVIDYANIDSVLKANEYNLSELVYNANDSSAIGNMLKVDYLVFSSFVWNGTYTMIDIHLTDVNTNQVIFQKTYLTDSDTDQIILKGIPNIVDDILGKSNDKTIFYDEKKYEETSEIKLIKQWARERKIATIFLVYGIISGYDKESWEKYPVLREKGSKIEKLYPVFKDVEKKALDYKDEIEKSGEMIKVIHLGSINNYNYDYDANSTVIFYQMVSTILNYQSTGVIFFGTRNESAIIDRFLSNEKRTRYWFRFSWDEN